MTHEEPRRRKKGQVSRGRASSARAPLASVRRRAVSFPAGVERQPSPYEQRGSGRAARRPRRPRHGAARDRARLCLGAREEAGAIGHGDRRHRDGQDAPRRRFPRASAGDGPGAAGAPGRRARGRGRVRGVRARAARSLRHLRRHGCRGREGAGEAAPGVRARRSQGRRRRVFPRPAAGARFPGHAAHQGSRGRSAARGFDAPRGHQELPRGRRGEGRRAADANLRRLAVGARRLARSARLLDRKPARSTPGPLPRAAGAARAARGVAPARR